MLPSRFLLFFLSLLWQALPTLAGTYEFNRTDSNSWGVIFQQIFGYSDFKKSYALVIGIDHYEDHKHFDNLDGPVADAVAVRDFLENEANFDQIVMLTDGDATLEKINYYMETFFPDKIQREDRFFFYFSLLCVI